MDIAYKYCVGLVSCTCGANLFLATSLQFGLIRISEDHHDKIVAFVIRKIEFALLLRSDRV
jgi:hypothetical protein